MNAKGRCNIPSNVCKIKYRPIDQVTLMANYIKSYVKCCTLCCCEGPKSIFCIKDCRKRSFFCCKLCEKDDADFDNYSDFEHETESEDHNYLSDGCTSLDSESE